MDTPALPTSQLEEIGNDEKQWLQDYLKQMGEQQPEAEEGTGNLVVNPPPLPLITCINSELVSTQEIPLGGSSGEHCTPHRGPDLSNQSHFSSANKAPDHTGNSDGPGMVGGDISGSCKAPCNQPDGSMGMIGNGSVGPSEILIQQIIRSTLRAVGM